MNDKAAADSNPTQRVERNPTPVSKHPIEDLLQRVDTQGKLLAALDLRLTELQRKHEELREAMKLQQRINLNNDVIDTTVRNMLEQLRRELGGLDERTQAWSERWNGTMRRIDRTQDVTAELRQRLDEHHKVIDLHTGMFDQQIETNDGLKIILAGIRETLVELVEAAAAAGGDDGKRDPGA